MWDYRAKGKRGDLPGGSSTIAFHPNGTLLASGTVDNLVAIWDLDKKEMLKDLTGHDELINALIFSPDGKLLVSGSNDLTIRFWETDGWNELAVRQIDSRIKHLAFSPDGQYLYAGNENLSCYRFPVSELLED